MKSFQMKALALAVLGLAGFGMTSSAFAVCPTAVTTTGTTTPGGGGAWSAQYINSDATFAIPSPGMNGTNCELALSIGTLSNSRVFVQDNSPNNEQRYRARFYLDLNNLVTGGNWTLSNQTVVVHRVNDTTSPAQFSSDQIVVRIAGAASTRTVRFFVADANQGSGAQAITVPLPASANNQYRIEYDLQIGTAATSTANGCTTMPAAGNGCFRYWVNAASDASGLDSAPTGSYTINNSGWSGAKTSFLGLSTGTLAFRSGNGTVGGNAGKVIAFDEFDSRRQTFIGQ